MLARLPVPADPSLRRLQGCCGRCATPAVFAIVGAVIANKKGAYRYPLTIRFVR